MNATPRTISFYLKRITGLILLLSLSAVFLFSAGTKIIAIQPFEWSFLDILPVTVTTAAVIARLFIGLEIAIGLFLLAHIFLRRFTYRASLVLLALLTLYLLMLLVKQGNTGSCGCFGETYQMRPLAAIWKNLGMIAATIALFFLYPVKPYKNQVLAAVVLAAVAFTAPFVLDPIYISGDGKPMNKAVDLNPVYQYGKPLPATELRKGKHIIAFFSLTCPHCRKAAYFLQIFHRQYPDIPLYTVLGGRPEELDAFLKDTQAASLPHSLVTDMPSFIAMAGPSVPSIYWVNNGIIERETYFSELNSRHIRAWLKQ